MSKHGRKIHEGNALNRDFIAMTVPVYLMAFFFYGPRALLLGLVGVLTARITDRFAAVLRGRRYDSTENSSVVIALILVLMLPATVPYSLVVMAVLVAVLVGKEAFGGYQSYPFNPSAVGFCVAAVSWPQQVFRYPAPLNWMLQENLTFEQLLSLWRFEGVTLVEGPSMTLRNGGLPRIDFWDLLLGNYAGPMGLCCSLVILSCAVYLLVRRRISVLAPAGFLAVVCLIAFVFPRYSEIFFATFPQDVIQRLQVVKFELLSGAIIFASVFMISEPGTLPKNPLSRLIYGILLGFATMMFRYFGTYELGTCFAILLVNAVSGYFDRAIASRSAKKKAALTTASP
ncbi:RnfABCDGE type electron transport complex subunit D [Ruminococcaceae bacterium OttesenSCG-928-O06]|nr:RnfABCDGE type electron transport complex subunit D [Ruminococcaceae bacterium OttesenSCG-928-O06]